MNNNEYERMFQHEGDYWWFIGRRGLVMELLKPHLEENNQPLILDIGCGTGAMSLELSKLGEVVSCDMSETALEYCKRRELNMLVRGDITELPYSNGSFDIVVALDILEHISDDCKGMEELRRILKPDGLLITTVPAYKFLWSGHDVALHHFRRYTAGDFKRRLVKSGFTVPKISYAVSLLFPSIFLFRCVGKLFDRKKTPSAHVVAVPGKVNAFLEWIQKIESAMIKKVNLPVGVTIIAVAKP